MNGLRSGSLAIALTLLLPAGAALAQDGAPSPGAAVTLSPAAQEFADAFPDETGGVPLAGLIEVVSAAGRDALDPISLSLMTDLAEGLGIGFDEIFAASAMTFDDFFAEEPTGVWIMAIKAPVMAPEAGVGLMERRPAVRGRRRAATAVAGVVRASLTCRCNHLRRETYRGAVVSSGTMHADRRSMKGGRPWPTT